MARAGKFYGVAAQPICVKVPCDLLEATDEVAKDEMATRCDVIRRALKEYVERKKHEKNARIHSEITQGGQFSDAES